MRNDWVPDKTDEQRFTQRKVREIICDITYNEQVYPGCTLIPDTCPPSWKDMHSNDQYFWFSNAQYSLFRGNFAFHVHTNPKAACININGYAIDISSMKLTTSEKILVDNIRVIYNEDSYVTDEFVLRNKKIFGTHDEFCLKMNFYDGYAVEVRDDVEEPLILLYPTLEEIQDNKWIHGPISLYHHHTAEPICAYHSALIFGILYNTDSFFLEPDYKRWR
jgi:hypothetical protein